MLQNWNSIPIEQLSTCPFTCCLATTIVFSVFMTLTTFDVSYKWNHTDLSLWCLAYFTQHNVLKVHPFCSMCQDLLFWLNNIPLYIFTTFSLSVYLSVDIWAASISWLLWVMLQYMWVYIEILIVFALNL